MNTDLLQLAQMQAERVKQLKTPESKLEQIRLLLGTLLEAMKDGR